MPNHRRKLRTKPTEGAGPWQFENENDLGAGESILWDFPNRRYNDRPGYFRPHLPFDQVVVSNVDGSNHVLVEYNGIFEQVVLPNTTESFDQAEVNRVRIVNEGSTAISAGDLKLEVLNTPYDADQAARERKERGPIGDLVNKWTGLGL